MERNPVKSFFLFVLAFVLFYIWNVNNIPPWGFIFFAIAIAICVIYGIRYWRGTSGPNTTAPKSKR